MMINVSEALDSDTATIITIIRSTSSVDFDEKGNAVNTDSVISIPALASPQQPTPEQLEQLKGGELSQNNFIFICNRKLKSSDVENNAVADVIKYNDKRYKVISVADWIAFGHCIAIAVEDKN